MDFYDLSGAPEVRVLDLRLPPLPQTLLRAIELSQQPDGPEVKQVIDLIQHDPAAVARVLRIVNAAYYGQRGEITSVRRAVVILGPASVTGIIMSQSVLDIRSALTSASAGAFLNIIRHSIATAFLAQLLFDAGADRNEAESEAFTAGMLHDFGKLVLLYNYPENAAVLYARPAAPGPELSHLYLERQALGFDHVEACLHLAQEIKLPASLTMALARHHDYQDLPVAGPERRLVLAVAAANKAANALDYDFNHSMSWEDLENDAIWEEMVASGLFNAPSPSAFFERISDAREQLDAYVEAFS